MSGTQTATGLFASLRRLAGTTAGIVMVRLQLLGTELEQEKLRVISALWLAGAALLLLWLALVLFVGFVVLLLWDGYRLAAVGGLALLFAGAGGWLLHLARQRLTPPAGGAFALSLAELRRDRDSLGLPDE
ncbi:MAG: phage holin family protein [Rubrivivax sp.]|nr:phage holin family protein [Rubrivivax sp.]